MNKLAKPRFNLKSPKSESETLILLLYLYKGKKIQYSTGMKVLPLDWNKKDNRAVLKERRSDLITLNHELDTIAGHCIDIYIESDNGKISVTDFKTRLKSKTSKNPGEGVSEKVGVEKASG